MPPIIDRLQTLLNERGDEVEEWLGTHRHSAPPYLYNSVDLRHSGVKLAPVDTNLYPAGFNHLSEAARRRAAQGIASYLEQHHSGAGKILLLPENHTRNLGYLENLRTLEILLKQAGAEVRIGGMAVESESLELPTLSGQTVTEYGIQRTGNTLETRDGFRPDLIVSNNDFTSGAPELLAGLSQPIIPPVEMGWWQRRKSVHFAAYQQLAEEFGQHFGLDSWLISTHFHRCGLINFHERTGLECVALGVEKVLHAVRRKYEEYGITQEPYVFIKADSGTYGMGIMTARSGEEVYEMNKKVRNKMNVIKEGAQNDEVIIQEGVPTIDEVNGRTAEPMLYVIDGVPVGGAYRVNAERDAYNNLNAQGMEFTGMCDESEGDAARAKIASCNFRAFGLIACLAALATARERY